MSRSRTTKTIAKRIDLGYFQRPHPFRTTRAFLSVGAAFIAVAVWILYALANKESAFNPGPVSEPHAHFEQNCSACHNADGHGGYSKAVADSACLVCHDAAAHHPTQTVLISADGTRAANCATCHIEHRGRTILAASSFNSLCTQCHADLPSATMSGYSTDVPASITAFDASHHPEFGRQLKSRPDASVIKFDHKVHLNLAEMKSTQAMQQCFGCHSTGSTLPSRTPLPSYILPSRTVRPALWDRSSEHRYMQPIQYERHCAGCHDHVIKIPDIAGDGPVLPHDRMEVVRAQLASLRQLFIAVLPADPKARQIKLAGAKEDDWAAAKVKDIVMPDIRFWLKVKEYPKANELKALLRSAPAAVAEVNKLEAFVAYGMGKASCVTCHQMRGELPFAYEKKRSAASAGETAQLHETVPIPTGPRRWLTSSRFDHDAHRDVKCLDCHGKIPTSDLTTPLHELLPTLGSCISCHHDPSSNDRGATTACDACHTFHDRTKERPLAR